MIRPKIALSQKSFDTLKKEALRQQKPLQVFLSELILKGYMQSELVS